MIILMLNLMCVGHFTILINKLIPDSLKKAAVETWINPQTKIVIAGHMTETS
jgi:hypothetical protein